MNIENFQKLHDAIAAAPAEQFSMSDYFVTPEGEVPHADALPPTMCGSAACLAGWAAFLGDPHCRSRNYDKAGEIFLGIYVDEAAFMFWGQWSPNGLSATRTEALAYLRACIEQRTVRPVMP